MDSGAQKVGGIYAEIAERRADSPGLQERVAQVVQELLRESTSTQRPGILLGRVQSGKTRAFLGVIALAFDSGFDWAVILTKGTRSLARQTLARTNRDFKPWVANDTVRVFDIMALPVLTGYELERKLIIVVKKEDDNLRRLEELMGSRPELRSRRLLIVDDEADMASVTYWRKDGVMQPGKIASQIDAIQQLSTRSSLLQVTATPYALYLQPDEAVPNGPVPFRPRRPSFTVILPPFHDYVGGDEYFRQPSGPDDPAAHFYEEVPAPERDALKEPDGRRLRLSDVLTATNAAVLRHAIVAFLAGSAARRLQQKGAGLDQEKYSFLFHTEQRKASHEWQEAVVRAILGHLSGAARAGEPVFDSLFDEGWADIAGSLGTGGLPMPPAAEVKSEVRTALLRDYVMITRVNSDQDVEALLNDEGELRLGTPYNVFIGGQILDRGITIPSLIAFYYGRNPQKMQQDTVLQHCRMYGARPRADLFVTRFYAPLGIYTAMRRIHELDAALRVAFESGAHQQGVYFLQRDPGSRIVPCSPNKLSFSRVVTVGPGSRLLPIGFQTIGKTEGKRPLAELDRKITALVGPDDGASTCVPLHVALELLRECQALLHYDDEEWDDDRRAQAALLEHLATVSPPGPEHGMVQLVAYRGRQISRRRSSGRFSDAPDTKREQNDAERLGKHGAPVLSLFRQEGSADDGWKGLAFWWPVLFVPDSATTMVFAGDVPA